MDRDYFTFRAIDRKGRDIELPVRALEVVLPQELLDIPSIQCGIHNWIHQFPEVGNKATRRIPGVQWGFMKRIAAEKFKDSTNTRLDEKKFYETLNIAPDLHIAHALVPLAKKQRVLTDVSRVIPIWLLHHFLLLCCPPATARQFATTPIFVAIREEIMRIKDDTMCVSATLRMLGIMRHILEKPQTEALIRANAESEEPPSPKANAETEESSPPVVTKRRPRPDYDPVDYETIDTLRKRVRVAEQCLRVSEERLRVIEELSRANQYVITRILEYLDGKAAVEYYEKPTPAAASEPPAVPEVVQTPLPSEPSAVIEGDLV